MIDQLLEKSKVENKVIGISLYGDEGFWCGVIIDYNDDIFQMKHYTSFGVEDGVIIDEVSKIERIDFDDEYTNALSTLIKNEKQLAEVKFKNRFFEDLLGDDWQELAIKPYLGEKNFMISIYFHNDNSFKGFVENVYDYSFAFRCIGDLGQDRGMSLFKYEDVASVKINDLECRKRLILYKNKR